MHFSKQGNEEEEDCIVPPHFVSWFSAPCCYPILAKIDRVPKSGLISLCLSIKSSKIFLFSIPKLDFKPWHYTTVFENLRKSLIQHCERRELCLHSEWTKVNYKCQQLSILASFWKSEACGQTVLPNKSLLIGQKLVEHAKIKKKFKCDIMSNF